MGLSLNALFQSGENKVSAEGASESLRSSYAREIASDTGEIVRSVRAGQTFAGEILESSGEDVVLRTEQGLLVQARISEQLQSILGSRAMFEVTSNRNGALSLRPLFTNLATDTTVSKALSDAGLPVSERNVTMVRAMMSEGMNVDRTSLMNMARQIASHSTDDILNIVQLRRLEIPVTEENLEQFSAYKNYSHKLVDAFDEVLDALPEAFTTVSSAGKEPAAALAFATDLMNSVFEGEDVPGSMPANPEQIAGTPSDLTGAINREIEQLKPVITALSEDSYLYTGLSSKDPLSADIKGAVLQEGTGKDTQSLAPGEGPEETPDPSSLADGRNADPALSEKSVLPNMLKNGLDSLRALEEKLGQSREIPEEAKKAVHDAIRELLTGKDFGKAVKNAVLKNWLIEGEDLSKESVKELYEKLDRQTASLMKTLDLHTGAESAISKGVANIRQNVSFMQQMNELYSYVQIPLSLSEQKAHGELFIYTNKKNLAQKDGDITAFLRLDMEHLGLVDVFVSLKSEKLQTHFRLEDEKSLDLIESHIDLLTKRLTDKGYNTSVKVEMKTGEKTVMDEVLSANRNIGLMSMQAFDVRA
ncbi:MAG: hypothetical protein E7300_08085 [Lachnospiraceae bacterium]|nr:hypothetical protein [Lachnospiraceae bacterium]